MASKNYTMKYVRGMVIASALLIPFIVLDEPSVRLLLVFLTSFGSFCLGVMDELTIPLESKIK